jgi:hypothetical protein
MELATTSWENEEEWELCNNDGFVYMSKKRVSTQIRQKEDKGRTLLKLKER